MALGAVTRMSAALARRGPNDEGMAEWDDCVLGHRRLAIFDLSSAGHQPMLAPGRSIGVVFNGAIYNFRKLRSELRSKGFEFQSGTDTEVLVHGYSEWGIDGLVARIDGMFAFGLWDERLQALYLVRDRLGVKPLAYECRSDGSLAFASTVRAVADGSGRKELDPAAVVEFLEFGYVTEERAIHRGVKKLKPATILEWRGGTVSMRRFWEAPQAVQEHRKIGFREAVDTAEELFLSAVKARLHADVPVGALLSGGIDSSLVCWAMSHLGADITTFTVSAPGDPWDEAKDARLTANELGLRHEVVEIAPAGDELLDDLVAAYPEPFGCASALGMLQVSRAVGAHARVVITGDGGDDVFLGYPRHRHLLMAQTLSRIIPESFAAGWKRMHGFQPSSTVTKRVVNFLNYSTGGLGAFLSVHDGLPYFWANDLLGERLTGITVGQREIPTSLRSARNILAEYLNHDREGQFVSEYLAKVDGATMFHGLEARSPFLDYRLWEFAGQLPSGTRLHRGRLKAVLREIARRRIGARVAGGTKRGFQIPVQRWLATRWYDLAHDAIGAGRLAADGWINGRQAVKELERHARSGFVPHQLWYLLVLERWMQSIQHSEPAPVLETRALV
ncbi:MAG: asparagine synthase (glutamine-hydrolyzing) [Gemmatimonadetes bacterium]|nr:asparagine synthase (glutamine-hydrolyzing) [Gemmatimonadota bacterium]